MRFTLNRYLPTNGRLLFLLRMNLSIFSVADLLADFFFTDFRPRMCTQGTYLNDDDEDDDDEASFVALKMFSGFA